jgi:hypothetical protein
MDTVLIAVTTLSLAMASGMAVVLVKLLREERRRSDARVAALTAMARSPVPPRTDGGPRDYRPTVAAAAPRHQKQEPLGELELRPSPPDVRISQELFADRDRSASWGGRLVVMGALAAVVAGGFFAATAGSTRSSGASARSASDVPVERAPLELRALRHLRDAQGLTISGVVNNPASGAPVSGLVATAFLFGSDGTLLTSRRAPIDLATLAPGQESPFAVTVPVTSDVSRYRIGFRTGNGQVIAHVDKRSPEALASTQEQP